jgi:hypothetical protein
MKCLPTGFVVGVGVWVFWSLRRNSLTIHNDDNVTRFDIIKHSLISAFAFALYTLSFGSHSELLKQALAIPDKMLKSIEGILMLVFPMIMRLFGDSYVSKPTLKTS